MQPTLTLSVSAAVVRTKDDGKEIIDGFREETFDLTNPAKLKKTLTQRVHSVNAFQDGVVHSDYNTGVFGIMLDFDGSGSLTEIDQRFADWHRVIYSSTNHTDELPKFHLLLPFDPAHLPAFPLHAYDLYRWCKSELRAGGFFEKADPAPFNLAAKFFPHCPAEANSELLFEVRVANEYFPAPDLKSFLSTAPQVQDIEPEVYQRQRTSHVKNLWQLDAGDPLRGDRTAFCLALDCRRSGDSEEAALSKLIEWNEQSEKPMAEERLRAKVRSAYGGKYPYTPPPDALQNPGMREWLGMDKAASEHDAADDPDAGLPLTEEELKGVLALKERVIVSRKERPLTDRTLRGAKLQRYAVKPLKRIGRLFWENRLTMYWGPEKQGKTRLLHADVLDIVNRESGNCLWVSSDESENDIINRLQRDGLCERIDLLYRPRSFAEILVPVYKYEPRLLVVDSLGSVLMTMGIECPQSYDKEGWQAIVDPYRALIERSSIQAVVFTDHSIRDGSRYSGSAGKGAAVDVLVGMSADKENDKGTLEIIGRVPEDGTTEQFRYQPEIAGGSYNVTRDIKADPDEQAAVDKVIKNKTDRILCDKLAEGVTLTRKEVVALLGVTKQALSKIKQRVHPKMVRVEKDASGKEVWYMSKGQAESYTTLTGMNGSVTAQLNS